MTTSEEKAIFNKPTIAVYAFGIEGLLIKDVIEGFSYDVVQYVTSFDGRLYTAKIYEDNDYRLYFKYGANKIYLDECMRVDADTKNVIGGF